MRFASQRFASVGCLSQEILLQREVPMSMLKSACIPFVLLLLCLTSGCGGPPRTQPTEEAKAKGVVDPGVTFLDYPKLQEGVGAMDADVSREFMTTDSGLQYRILRKSDGKKPIILDSVTVHYRGWLDNGRVFDGSYSRGQTTSFALRGVVAGWTEGLQLVGTGGMIELWIPSELGYGSRGAGSDVPPNAALHFVVELMSIDE